MLEGSGTVELAPNGLDLVARTYGIRLLLLFGSAVSGREHPESDVDLGLLLKDPDVDYSERAALGNELQKIFPGREVDLAILNHADPLFLKKVTERCRLVYGDTSELQSLQMYAFRRYQDHRRFLEMERRYVKHYLTRILNPS
jgi:uncharacterized protein